MYRLVVVAAILTGAYAIPTAVDATVGAESCEVAECADGTISCTQVTRGGGEVPDGGAAQVPQKCKSQLVDAPCSEVPACGRRVPALSIVGLTFLGLGMMATGWRVVRRRQAVITSGTP